MQTRARPDSRNRTSKDSSLCPMISSRAMKRLYRHAALTAANPASSRSLTNRMFLSRSRCVSVIGRHFGLLAPVLQSRRILAHSNQHCLEKIRELRLACCSQEYHVPLARISWSAVVGWFGIRRSDGRCSFAAKGPQARPIIAARITTLRGWAIPASLSGGEHTVPFMRFADVVAEACLTVILRAGSFPQRCLDSEPARRVLRRFYEPDPQGVLFW